MKLKAYVFALIDKRVVTPLYAGISGTIYRRLKQHTWGGKHNEASLAYLMASLETGYKKTRARLDQKELIKQQEIIRKCHVVIYPETDDCKLYFLEAYVAAALKTKCNRFRTH